MTRSGQRACRGRRLDVLYYVHQPADLGLVIAPGVRAPWGFFHDRNNGGDRARARQTPGLHNAMHLVGTIYNFCSYHQSLRLPLYLIVVAPQYPQHQKRPLDDP